MWYNTLTAPSDVWLELHDKTIVQPDLYVVCDYPMFGKDGHTKGAPPFVVEVLSSSTRIRDMLLKIRLPHSRDFSRESGRLFYCKHKDRNVHFFCCVSM